ncbi:hypothetical protein JHK84_031521 [Glycine max]|nr:hypothetical protein JHK84_031521 [Glycine max]
MKVGTSTKNPIESKVLYMFLLASITLALIIMAMIIAQRQISLSKAAYINVPLWYVLCLSFPMFIVVRKEFLLWNMEKKVENTSNEVIIKELEIVEPRVEDAKISCFANIFNNKPKKGEDHTILQALLSIGMLLLLISSFVEYGTNVAVMDNLGQISKALSRNELFDFCDEEQRILQK